MNKGWICLHRQIQDNILWKDKPFSRGQAWIDLLLMANHEPADILLDNEVLHIERGQFHTSMYKLSERWGWSRKKVNEYLKLLEKLKMGTTIKTSKGTTVTIIKYEDFQRLEAEERADEDMNKSYGRTTEELRKNYGRATEELRKSLNNNDNNENNDNNIRDKGSMSTDVDPPKLDYQKIVEMYHSTCVSYPKLQALSDKRKKAIKARSKTYSIEQFQELFEKAEASDFLKGKNNRNWSATFDWLMCDSNFAKVLDGNYDNKASGKTPSNSSFEVNEFFEAAVNRTYNFEKE